MCPCTAPSKILHNSSNIPSTLSNILLTPSTPQWYVNSKPYLWYMCCDALALDTWSALPLPPGSPLRWWIVYLNPCYLWCAGTILPIPGRCIPDISTQASSLQLGLSSFHQCSSLCSCCQTFQVDKLNMAHHYTDSNRYSLQPTAGQARTANQIEKPNCICI